MEKLQEGKPPINYTGKWNNIYLYKGQRWDGPTNLIGAKPIVKYYGNVPSEYYLTTGRK